MQLWQDPLLMTDELRCLPTVCPTCVCLLPLKQIRCVSLMKLVLKCRLCL